MAAGALAQGLAAAVDTALLQEEHRPVSVPPIRPHPRGAQTHVPVTPTASSFSPPKRVYAPRPRQTRTRQQAASSGVRGTSSAPSKRRTPARDRPPSLPTADGHQSGLTPPAPADPRLRPSGREHVGTPTPPPRPQPVPPHQPRRSLRPWRHTLCALCPEPRNWSFAFELSEDFTQVSDPSRLIAVARPEQGPSGRGLPAYAPAWRPVRGTGWDTGSAEAREHGSVPATLTASEGPCGGGSGCGSAHVGQTRLLVPGGPARRG